MEDDPQSQLINQPEQNHLQAQQDQLDNQQKYIIDTKQELQEDTNYQNEQEQFEQSDQNFPQQEINQQNFEGSQNFNPEDQQQTFQLNQENHNESSQLLLSLKKSKEDYTILLTQKKNISELEKKSLLQTIQGIDDQIRLLEVTSSQEQDQQLNSDQNQMVEQALNQDPDKQNEVVDSNNISNQPAVDTEQIFKVIFLHYGKKGAKTSINTFGNLEAQHNTWDIHKYSMFTKEFNINQLIKKDNLKAMFKRNLSQNNEMLVEQFLKFIEQLKNEYFKGSQQEMLDYLGINDNSFLKRLGLPDFITDISKIYVKQKRTVIEISAEKKRALYPEPPSELQQKIKNQQRFNNNKSKNNKNIKEAKDSYLEASDIVSWDILNANKKLKTLDKDFDAIRNMIDHNDDEDDEFYLQNYKIDKHFKKGSSPLLKQKQVIQQVDASNQNGKIISQREQPPQQYYNIGNTQGTQEVDKSKNKNQRSMDIPPQQYYDKNSQQINNSTMNNNQIQINKNNNSNSNSNNNVNNNVNLLKNIKATNNRNQIVGSSSTVEQIKINQISDNERNNKVKNINYTENIIVLASKNNNQLAKINQNNQQKYLTPEIDYKQQQRILNNQQVLLSQKNSNNNSGSKNSIQLSNQVSNQISKKELIGQQEVRMINKYLTPRKLSHHQNPVQQIMVNKKNNSIDNSYFEQSSNKQSNQNQILNRADQLQLLQIQKEKDYLNRILEQGKLRQYERSPGQKVVKKYKLQQQQQQQIASQQ